MTSNKSDTACGSGKTLSGIFVIPILTERIIQSMKNTPCVRKTSAKADGPVQSGDLEGINFLRPVFKSGSLVR